MKMTTQTKRVKVSFFEFARRQRGIERWYWTSCSSFVRRRM